MTAIACPSTWRARAALTALAVAIAASLHVALTPDPDPPFVPPPGSPGDLELYRRVVDHMRAGEPYHDAAQRELRTLGYPTRSVFNFRTPVHAWTISRLPRPEWGQALLCLGMLATVGLWCFELLDAVPFAAAAAAGVCLVGSTSACFSGQTFLLHELWAGTLIAFSAVALRRGWISTGVAAGLAALFVRELALPYVVVCLGTAALRRRRGEALAWAAGLLGFAAMMVWHHAMVEARVTAVDQAMPGGWVRFGGIRFILMTAQANVFLMSLPLWATAIYAPLAALGLASWGGVEGRRVGLTGGLYLAAFAVVGAPFNYYWGFMYGPLLAIGLAQAPGAIWGLAQDAFPALSRRANAGQARVCPSAVSAVS